MGVTTMVEVGIVKTYLNKLKQLDHGTTVAGTIAAVLLANGLIDLNKLIGGTPMEKGVECAKAAAVFTFWLVMKMIGKPVDIDAVIAEAEAAAPAPPRQ